MSRYLRDMTDDELAAFCEEMGAVVASFERDCRIAKMIEQDIGG
jgi:hypothetical protein